MRIEGMERYMDINDGREWSDMDLFDMQNSIRCGDSIEDVAIFLHRSGTVDEVRAKAMELGLIPDGTVH